MPAVRRRWGNGVAMRNVLFIQEMVKHYRRPFFEQLHDRLAAQGVKVRVAYGKPRRMHTQMKDLVQLRPDIGLEVPTKWLLNNNLVYQRVGRHILDADLVIVEQAAKYVWNYPLVLGSMLGWVRLAQWGHGYNRSYIRRGMIEWLKRKSIRYCDRWFAYTPGTADFVIKHGMPADKVTVVWNSIDMKPLLDAIDGVTGDALAALTMELGIPKDARIGLYVGGLYEEKLLPLLLEAAVLIKAQVPDFHLMILGDGPKGDFVRAWAKETDWTHTLGATFGARKAQCLKVADIFLCPGVLGLAVLDAFAGATPVLTTDTISMPEEEYLVHGINGIRTTTSAQALGQASADLLNDPGRLAAMKQAAAVSGREHSIERMVGRFEEGILKCLNEPRQSRRVRFASVDAHKSRQE